MDQSNQVFRRPNEQINFLESQASEESIGITDQNLNIKSPQIADDQQYLIEPNSEHKMNKNFWKWIVIIIIIYLNIAQNYCQVIPQGLQTYLQQDLNISAPQYGYITIAAYIPNMILPAFVGLIIDKLVWAISQGILFIAAIADSYTWVFFGSVLCGITGGSMSVNFSIIVSKWFMGDLLAMAMGLMMAAQSLSSLMAQLILPPLYEMANELWVPYLSGLIFSVVAVACCIFVSIIDKRMDESIGEFKDAEAPDKFVISDICKMSLIFWFWSIMLAYTNMIQTGFTNYAQGIIMDFQKTLSPKKANQINGLQFIIQTIVTSPVGWFTDKFGVKGEILVFSLLLEVGSFLIIFFFFTEYWAIFMFISIWGIVQSIQNALQYSAIPLIIDEKVLGTGFGMTVCFSYIGNSIGPVLAGLTCNDCKANQFCQGYKNTIELLGGMTIIALFFGIYIFIYDLKIGAKLRIIQSTSIKSFLSAKGVTNI